jgi:hypothetical protein
MAWDETLYDGLFNLPVMLYFLLVLVSFVLPPLVFQLQRQRVAARRKAAGLPGAPVMNPEDRLRRDRREATWQAMLLLGAVFVGPLVLILLFKPGIEVKGGLLTVFLAILLWLLLQGTDVAKAFLGGLVLKTLLPFQRSMQVGNRVTLKGYSGKLTKINTFFVTLQTPDDDLVSIPTRKLWSEVLISANAGERSSLSLMAFYLASFASKDQRQMAEDIIWDAVQASPYCDTAKPMQIYLEQLPDAIRLTAKAYVTSTYNDPLFRSDVTRAFLNRAADKGIPLGISQL